MSRVALLPLLLSTACFGPADPAPRLADQDRDGYAPIDGDCDDADDAVHPGADEHCDGLDEDCDGLVDEHSVDAPSWYGDSDGDGWGNADDVVIACTAPDGYLADASDCDDANDTVYPGADEHCDDVDEDCDGEVDEEAVDAPSWYADDDGDGWGNPDDEVISCTAPCGYLDDASDCDDTDPAINPDAQEVCSDRDEDCDELVDDEDDSVIGQDSWYADADADGYGDPHAELLACVQPTGHVQDATDCDDERSDVHPGLLELLDGVDNDCDGQLDTTSLGGSDAVLQGEAGGDQAARVAYGGDLDGDGLDDLIVGSHFQDAGAEDSGALYLVYLQPTGTSSLADAGGKLLGEGAEDLAGFAAVGLGDANGDGVGDLLVSAPWQDASAKDAGAAYLVLGPVTGELSLADADAKLLGEAADDRAGASVASADIDGDGLGDLLLAADQEGTMGPMSGAAYLVLGPVTGELSLADADAKLLAEEEGDTVGYYGLAGVNDMNGDGFDEIAVGAPRNGAGNAGAAYLLYGPVTGEHSLADADAKLTGEEDGDWAGFALDGSGDVDGDGHPDLLVGARNQGEGGHDAGAAYLVLGPITADSSLADAHAKLVGEDEDDLCFRGVIAGDVDGDELDDLLLGARQNDNAGEDAGAAYLLLGPASGTIDMASADAIFLGEAAGDHAGRKVARAGDVDGDGLSDLLFGAYYNADGGTDAGAAYLLLGRPRP